MKKIAWCLMVPLLLVGGVFALTCFQGLDLADEWFWFSNAHVLSVAPDKTSYSFGYYLSVALSALWGWLISDSLISFRFLAVLSKLLIMVMAYFVLRKSIDKTSLFWGLTLGGLFTYGGVMCFYGNTCTSLFYMAALVWAYNWIETEKRIYLFLFGLMLGIGVFARIANITDVLFFLIIPFYRLANREFQIGRVFFDCLMAFGGWILGVTVVLTVMFFVGHSNAFVEMLGTYSQIAEDSASGHSLSHLIVCQLRYYWDTIYYSSVAASVVVVAIVAAFTARKCSAGCAKTAVLVSAVVSTIVLMRLLLLLCRFPVVAAFIVCFLLVIFLEKRPKILALWVLALLCLTVSPLGSDVAGTSNKYCMPLYLSLVFSAISRGGVVEKSLRSLLKIPEGSVRNIRMVLYGLLLLLGIGLLRQIWLDPIRDNSNRSLLTTCAQVKGLEYIRTTPERAKAIEDIVAEIKKQADQNQPLLVFHSAPGLHALTGMLPYTCSTWSFLLSPDLFNIDIEKARKRFGGRLPLVVLMKWAIGCREWPQERKAYINSNSTRWGRRLALDKFLADNNYQSVFEDEDFIIFKPCKK